MLNIFSHSDRKHAGLPVVLIMGRHANKHNFF